MFTKTNYVIVFDLNVNLFQNIFYRYNTFIHYND